MSISAIGSNGNYYGNLNIGGTASVGGGQRPGSDDLAQKIDKNSDGQVTKEEVQAWADDMKKNAGLSVDVDALFEEYDTDGDGSLTVDQLGTALEAQRATMQGPPPPPGGMPPASPSSDNLAAMIDKDEDGSVTQAEVQAWADDMKKSAGLSIDVDALFEEYDTDGDGSLTVDQLSTALDVQREAMIQNSGQNAYGYGVQQNAINLFNLEA